MSNYKGQVPNCHIAMHLKSRRISKFNAWKWEKVGYVFSVIEKQHDTTDQMFRNIFPCAMYLACWIRH